MTLREPLDRLVRSRVAQTSAALTISQVLLGASGIVAARALGPSGRGIVGGVVAWMTFFPSLWLLGMNSALGIRVAQRPRDIRTAAASALAYAAIVGFPVALAGAFIVPRIVSGLGGGAAGIARWAVPPTVVMAMLSEMLLAVTLARGRYFVFNGCRVLLPLIPLTVAIGFTVRGGLTPTVMVGANVAASAACLLWLGASIPWRSASFDLRAFVSDLRFGAVSAISGWAAMANARLDVLLMSAFVTASQLGYYGVANNVMIPVLTIPAAAATVLVPRVAALLDEDGIRSDEIIRRQASLIWTVARRYLLVSVAGGAALAASAPFVIPLLFGDSFRPAVILIWILVPGFIGRAVTAIVTNAATAMRYPRVGNLAELVALLVTVVLLALLLPGLAAKGAAIASTAAYITSALVAVIGLRRLESAAARRASEADELEGLEAAVLEQRAVISSAELS
jgi:O-antigen/teichoic acid export membrane protein